MSPFKAGYHTVSAITEARLHKVLECVPGALAFGLRVLRLAESSFRAPDEPTAGPELFDLSESTLRRGEPDMHAIAAEVLLKEGVTLDAPWEVRSIERGSIVVAEGIAVVCSAEIAEEVVRDALDLRPRVVAFLEDGFAGMDTLKANAFTKARELGITMKTV